MRPDQIAAACVARMLKEDAASRAMGMAVLTVAPGHVTTRMTVAKAMTNGFDICHGGYLFALADSTIAFAANTYDDVTVLGAASIDILRSAVSGMVLTAEATELHRGKRTAIYDATVRNPSGEVVATMRGRCTRLGRPVLA
jgi:acyl-CoA thioesterase